MSSTTTEEIPVFSLRMEAQAKQILKILAQKERRSMAGEISFLIEQRAKELGIEVPRQ